jgi:hypothetical protein
VAVATKRPKAQFEMRPRQFVRGRVHVPPGWIVREQLLVRSVANRGKWRHTAAESIVYDTHNAQ